MKKLYESGQKLFEGNYKNENKDGDWAWWHENGQLKKEGNYKDGEEDGKWTEWYENGQLKAETNYKDGEYDRKSTSWHTSWHENGQLETEGKYKDGKKDGKFTWWHENGDVIFENNFNSSAQAYYSYKRKQIIYIKEKLFSFLEDREDEEFLDVYAHPVQTFTNKDKYPIDFQIFMEEIGEFQLSKGYEMIQIQIPFPLEQVDEEDEMADNLRLVSSFYPTEGQYFGKPLKNYEVFANEVCNFTMYSFDTSVSPYKIIDQDGIDCGSFLELDL